MSEEQLRIELATALVRIGAGEDEAVLFQWHPCVDTPACRAATDLKAPCACSGIPYLSDVAWAALAPILPTTARGGPVAVEITAMPTKVAAWLVAGHVDNLWQQWANDKDVPGCCPNCCGPCAGLKELLDLGQLDDLHGAYVDHTGGTHETWDAEKRQVGRGWLLEAWSIDCQCGGGES